MTDTYRVLPAVAGPSPEVVRRHGPAATWATTVTGPTEPTGASPDLMIIALPAVRALSGFTSSWGLEFEPRSLPVDEPVVWQVTSGRSSNGALPWLAAETDTGVVVITVHWSGNWRFVVTPGSDGTQIAVGLHPDGQRVILAAGERLRLPEVSVAVGETTAEAAAALATLLSEQVPPRRPACSPSGTTGGRTRTPRSTRTPSWPRRPSRRTWDSRWRCWTPAGSAGPRPPASGRPSAVTGTGSTPPASRTGWPGWPRRPAGAASPSASGSRPRPSVRAPTVSAEHPEIVARSADGDLGYVCLGSAAGQRHVHDHVARLITETGARWIKWDFNLDPGFGCRRDDHGHTADDGLLRHYLGLYAVLDRLRAAHPDTVFEACSSGGLRIDAGLAAHVDGFFLSDPDWTEHHLTCLWGAARLLPPRQLLHWPQSEWRGEHRFQKVDYSGTLITAAQFDTKIRAAMLHRFGISIRLTQLRADLRERLGHHLRVYEQSVRPLLIDGILRPLTDQPLREEKGHRQPAYQLSAGDDHVVAAFLLPPKGGGSRCCRPDWIRVPATRSATWTPISRWPSRPGRR